MLRHFVSCLRPRGGSLLWLIFAGLIAPALLYPFGRKLLQPNRDTESVASDRVALATTIFIWCWLAYYLFIASWHMWGWYCYPSILVAIFVVPTIIESARRRWLGTGPRSARVERVLVWLAVAGTVTSAIRWGSWAGTRPDLDFRRQNVVVAAELHERLGPDARLAMGGSSGSLGYFYDGHILQLEGLVGGYDVLDAIRTDTIEEYMTSFGVEYVVAYESLPEEYATWTFEIPSSWHTMGPRARLRVRREWECYARPTRPRPIRVWRWVPAEAGS